MVQINMKTKYKRQVRRRDGTFSYDRIDEQWQWVNDDNRWADYPPDINQLLTESKHKQLPSVKFQVSKEAAHDHYYTVDFKMKLQINSKTSYKRAVRCIPVYRRDATWEWKDDNGSFHSYSDECQELLENAYKRGEQSLDLSVCKRCYTVNFVRMLQTRKGYKTQRTVIRKSWSKMTNTFIAYVILFVWSSIDCRAYSSFMCHCSQSIGCISISVNCIQSCCM
jgi:hypothetical protein